ncbi:MAG: hypothetical protein ACFCBW_06100 [Candidatus Competibacterales bacterium]
MKGRSPNGAIRLFLAVPGLRFPRLSGPLPSVRAPRLTALLTRGQGEAWPAHPTAAALAAWGVGHPSNPLPVASLTGAFDGLDTRRGYWLRADPVCLGADVARLTLLDPAPSLTPAETESLGAAYRQQLARPDLTLWTPHPRRWYLSLEGAPRLITTPLESLTLGPLPSNGLAGADAGRFAGHLTEIQMLFHGLPVNEARRAKGLAPVNSLWLWGGGSLPPPPPQPPWRSAWSDPQNALVAGLGRWGGVEVAPLPADFGQWRAKAAPGDHWLWWEQAFEPRRRGDVAAWVTAIETLERQWLAPAWRLLGRGLGELVVDGGDGMRFRATARQRWQLWRRGQPYALWRDAP